ncbi:hypothetical protein RM697_08935 [Ichthyenterobacterium sp. W332]|uniref:Uncharacterized protein n=1 Tax=Microcosmobacter mediterraneus TaxID=3075607 RepID=A0ABU2YKS6_9FLAO|nr:hypothetical protein [Ichthyenterobacterium sp. W332]MDT0558771.1 hypothetical protein [Ichthyenterobacterium sp. W332]
MEEFLRANYGLLTHGVELTSAIVGLSMYKKFRGSYVKYFIWFLCAVALIELIGSYPKYFIKWDLYHIIENTLIEENYWWFELLWSLGATIFLSWYLQQVNSIAYYKNVIKYIRYVFIVVTIIYLFKDWTAIFYPDSSFIGVTGSIVVVFSAFLLFLDFLLSDKILIFFKDINFYISSILFIWYLSTTSLVFYEIYFDKADWNFVFLKWQIYLIANMFMYLSFSIALLCCKPQNK